jgi:hypothetical protein
MTNERAILIEKLALVEKAIGVGERGLAHQRSLVQGLEVKGEDPRDARQLFDEMEQLLAEHKVEKGAAPSPAGKVVWVKARRH